MPYLILLFIPFFEKTSISLPEKRILFFDTVAFLIYIFLLIEWWVLWITILELSVMNILDKRRTLTSAVPKKAPFQREIFFASNSQNLRRTTPELANAPI